MPIRPNLSSKLQREKNDRALVTNHLSLIMNDDEQPSRQAKQNWSSLRINIFAKK